VKHVFPYVVLSASLGLAGTAAYYSVFGLSKLFSAQAVAVIVMASILEVSKLITASYLHREWKSISALLKSYLVIAVFILMCITSLGIYGFLVSSYQETAYKLKNQESELSVLELKKQRYQTATNDIRSEKESLNKNITELTSGLSNNVIQYTNAEGQLITTTSSATRRVLEKQLDQTISRRDTLYSREIAYSDSVSNLDQQMLKIQTESEVSAEVGPIKYVAQHVNQSVDSVVNWFIMLFIFVFDPLAVMLLIAANRLFETKDPLSEVIPEVAEEESQAERVKAPTSPTSSKIKHQKPKIIS
jgi:spore coat protein CotF